MKATFAQWWNDWAARNEALYDQAQRERELAVARRWADAHIRFHFGEDAVRKDGGE